MYFALHSPMGAFETAFEMAFPTKKIRLIDEFLSTFNELTIII